MSLEAHCVVVLVEGLSFPLIKNSPHCNGRRIYAQSGQLGHYYFSCHHGLGPQGIPLISFVIKVLKWKGNNPMKLCENVHTQTTVVVMAISRTVI